MANTQPDKSRIIHNGKARNGVYIGAAIVVAAMIVATLTSTDILTGEQVDNWTESVVSLVGQFAGLVGLILAALNRSSDKPTNGGHAADHEPPAYVPPRHDLGE